MMARTAVGNPAGRIRFALPTIFVICCMFFSGVLSAEPQTGNPSEPAVSSEPVVSTEANTTAQPAVEEKAPADTEVELEEILKKNNRCLTCHKRERVKTLEDGEELSLQIHRDDYNSSAHGEVACVSCHISIGNMKHPSRATNIAISSQRKYSLEMNESCRQCHDKQYQRYEGSIHASMISQGSTKAPVCTDCHSAHAIKTMDQFQTDTGYPCRKCHENIYMAYKESVHGSAMSEGNTIMDSSVKAPICKDCHHAHDVTAMEIGDTLRSKCFECHKDVPLQHGQWLPNAGKHLDVVSCAVCQAQV